jgi:hypothetical protein
MARAAQLARRVAGFHAAYVRRFATAGGGGETQEALAYCAAQVKCEHSPRPAQAAPSVQGRACKWGMPATGSLCQHCTAVCSHISHANALARQSCVSRRRFYPHLRCRQHDYSTYLCTLALPARLRPAAFAVRAFNVETAQARPPL